MTEGLWWRWQDLNLRPWYYDAPAPPRIIENLGLLSKTIKYLGQIFAGKLINPGAIFYLNLE